MRDHDPSESAITMGRNTHYCLSARFSCRRGSNESPAMESCNAGVADTTVNLMGWKSPAVTCSFGRLARPMPAKVTTRVRLGRKCHGCLVIDVSPR